MRVPPPSIAAVALIGQTAPPLVITAFAVLNASARRQLAPQRAPSPIAAVENANGENIYACQTCPYIYYIDRKVRRRRQPPNPPSPPASSPPACLRSLERRQLSCWLGDGPHSRRSCSPQRSFHLGAADAADHQGCGPEEERSGACAGWRGGLDTAPQNRRCALSTCICWVLLLARPPLCCRTWILLSVVQHPHLSVATAPEKRNCADTLHCPPAHATPLLQLGAIAAGTTRHTSERSRWAASKGSSAPQGSE